ncbi:MAG: copper homeostasis protein CutC [Spirochaetota bacterium]
MELTRRVCSSLRIPVMTMIRPRAGDAVWTNAELDLMKRQIDAVRACESR